MKRGGDAKRRGTLVPALCFGQLWSPADVGRTLGRALRVNGLTVTGCAVLSVLTLIMKGVGARLWLGMRLAVTESQTRRIRGLFKHRRA